jgi:putative tryptophan/tyrosine transport system substrate-binding protein
MIPSRRRFLLAAGTLAAAPLARGQQRRLPVIGELNPNPRPAPAAHAKRAWVVRLRELGWVEGVNYRHLGAHSEGEAGLGERAEFLVRSGVDLIYAIGPEAAVAAARSTKTIPIVFWGVPYAVEQGLVVSLARPGRNVTGTAWTAGPGVDAKRLEVLKEIAPHARRLANITVPTAVRTVSGAKFDYPPSMRLAAERLGYEKRDFPIAASADIEPALANILAWKAQAATVAGTMLTVRELKRLVGFTLRNRLPASFVARVFVEAGGLVSYGMTLEPTGYRLGEFMDKILRGADPGTLPVDVPRDYEMFVNLKTATALGLTVPQSVLLRADRVIA